MKKKSLHLGAGVESARLKDPSSNETNSISTGSFDSADFTDTDASGHVRTGGDSGKSRVRFRTKRNKLLMVESHSEFTAKERGRYWWSDREKDRMMAKHERLVAKYELQRSGTKSGKMSADKLGSYRGLESWTAAGSLKLDHTIEQCITTVMDEQDRQWNENDDDAGIIAQKSLEVTEDSARRARLNGLQDAQEALRIRGENWSLKNPSDEMSIGSVVSTGTAAVAKKKKRSKLLARLDDSAKIQKSSSRSSVHSTSKKESKKSKKTKKTKTKKSKKLKKTKSTDITEGDEEATKRTRESDDGDTSTTNPTTVSSTDEQDKVPMDDVSIPVSPLGTPDEKNNDQVHPLLAALRQEQEKQKQSPPRGQEAALSTIYDRDSGSEEDENDIIALLRQQQRKQAISWSSPQKRGGDPGEGGNLGIPERSGAPVNKLSSLREDYTRTPSESANISDPPGRRPRRLQSRHGIPEDTNPDRKERSEKEYSDASAHLSDDDSGRRKDRSTKQSRDGSGKKSIMTLRNGAKALFRKGAKV